MTVEISNATFVIYIWFPGGAVWPFRWGRCQQSGQSGQWGNDVDEQRHEPAKQTELVGGPLCQSKRHSSKDEGKHPLCV